jgi:hypothetical protein
VSGAWTQPTKPPRPRSFLRSPYRRQSSSGPLRVAFVGQSTFFEACALGDELPHVRTTFVEYRAGADPERMLARVVGGTPDVVVVFKPELVPPGLFSRLRSVTLGFLTEPIPRGGGKSHPDLERRVADLRAIDPLNFDRIISFDPLMASTAAEIAPVWRSLPLPVADRYYRQPQALRLERRALFIGRSTPHRELLLTPSKHRHDLLHIAHGVDADMLERLLDEHDVAVNAHNEPYSSFENRVCLHLAAGHLVITEPLSPTHGLEAGIDYLEFHSPYALEYLLAAVPRFPSAFEGIRIRGRMKAELFRASAVYPRLFHDLFLDLAAFGTARATATTRRRPRARSAETEPESIPAAKLPT